MPPTVEHPHRYVDTHAYHGWVYVDDGRWVIEHTCGTGIWRACSLFAAYPVDLTRPWNLVTQGAYRHLRRRPHEGNLPVKLRGIVHA